MTGWLLLVVATAAVVLGAALASRLLRLDSPLDRLLAAFVLALAQVVLVSIVVGAMLHRFDRWWLFAGVVVSDVPLAAAVRRLRPPRGPRLRMPLRELRPWQLVLAGAAVCALAWRFALAVVLPPFAYDALTYHLTAVASWVQSGRIGPNPYAPCCARYPANAEALFAWPAVLLGRDTFVDAVQIVGALVGALAVAGLARTAGVSRAGALTASSLFLLIPIVLTQANTDYNDLTVAALFLAALHFAARLAVERSLVYAGLAGVAAGLAFGAKTTGIGLAVALALGIVVALRRRAAPGLAVFAVAVLLTGGWWYAKNWADTGNPVSPFRVRVLGTTIFNGDARVDDYLTPAPSGSNAITQVAHAWYADLHFWTHRDYSYEERSGGLGPLWSWLGWPALTVAALAALRRRRTLAATVVLPAAIAFAALPYRWWSRFTIYLAALGIVAIVVLLERLDLGRLRVPALAAVVGLALAGGGLATWRLDPAGFGRTLKATDVVSLAAHPSRPRTAGALFFHEYAWLKDAPSNATVAVELDAVPVRFIYPLFGAKLDRRIVLLLPGDERRIEALVGRRGPAYLFVGQHGAFARWAREHPRRFRPLEISRGTEAFRLTTILST